MTAIEQTQLEEMLAPWMEAVYAADRAYEAALGTEGESAARQRYSDARTDYRIREREAFAEGWYWTCGRCDGTGRWPGNGGVCFNCGGSGFHPNQTPHKFEAAPPIRAKRASEHEQKMAAERAATEAALDKLPAPVAAALRAAHDRYTEVGGFYGHDEHDDLSREEAFRQGLYEKLRKYGRLSDTQVAAVERGLERDAKKAADEEALKSAPPLAAGKRDVEGEILTTKIQHSDRFGSTLKMLVKQDDGNNVWGTVPAALEDLTRGTWDDEGIWVEPPVADLVGCRVAFTATVERSADDEHFGFYSRPTKARLA
jgi:hypothetical protein